MAERTGFDFVQATIGKSLHKLADYFSNDPFVGINNDWFALYTSVYGSMDYYHLVAFPLSGMYSYQHPMYLGGISDGCIFGYINSDLTNSGKESHLVVNNIFDVDWAPCPDGNDVYPAWNGWPVVNGSLPSYPVYGSSNRMFVFLKAMMIKIESSVIATYDKTFKVDATRMLSESLRQDNYYDIRAYRYNSATNDPNLGWIPSGSIYELPRTFSSNNLVIQVGRTAGENIPINVNGEPRFFIIYWESPDDYCITAPPSTTTPNDVTSFLTFNDGNTPLARELFDTYRYDLVDFANSGNKYLKNYYSTRYEFIDGNPQHVNDPNPIFYSLPAMRGSLDPNVYQSMPGIGNFWGYGYSLDQGTNNPSDDILQGVIICYQASAGNDTIMEVIVGPPVPAEFQTNILENFEWYPPIPDEYTLFAKIVIRVLHPTRHQASYRPNTIVEYLEYIKSYGKEKVENERYFSYLYQILLENAFLNNYLETILSPILVPIIYMTPVTQNRIGGMQYNSVYILNGQDVFNIFNTYWKIPVQHPLVPATSMLPVDSMHDYINQQTDKEYGQLEFEEDIRRTLSQNGRLQLSTILGQFYSDDNNVNFGTQCYNNKKIYIPTKLEIHSPIINSCYSYSELPKFKYDYSFRFKLRSSKYDYIQKDIYLSASKYYINDAQASELIANGLNPEQYLWPAKLNTNNEWLMYGRTVLIPDLIGGENATLEMKQFKPRDLTLPLYDEFVADLESQYFDDLNSGDPIRVNNAQQAISDAIMAQEYLYGGFDNPDTRTLENLIYSMDEFLIGVSLYNSTGIPYWDTTIDFWGAVSSYFNPTTGYPSTRYGFSLNEVWYYQNFIESLVANARRIFIEEHPISFYILQEQDDDTGSPNVGFGLDDSKYALSTTFTADFADVYNKIYKINVKLRLKNVPTAKLVLTINNTNFAKVPSDILQISDVIDYTMLSDDFEWIEFNFTQPVELTDGNRYALVLSASDPLSSYHGVDAINTIEWAFASVDRHSYGITDINSLLTIAAKVGDNRITVSDGNVYSSAPFYIKIGGEIFQVTSLVGNYLYISGSLVNDYPIDTPIYEVVYISSDSEVRWTYNKNGEIYDWVAPTNPSYDATYQLFRKVDDVGMVTVVPIEQWNGADLSTAKSKVDAFYISASTDSYSVNSDVPVFYGSLSGLSPFAGFNVANSYDFPPVNTWRAGYTNLVDGVVTWSSKEVDTPIEFYIFPLAIYNIGIQYLPTKHDMYITVICKKPNGQKKIINKFLPAGTATPVSLDSELFIGIDLLWVDSIEFKSEPFYGFGPAEAFVVRSV